MGVITLPMGRINQEPVPAKEARLNVVAVLLCLVPVGAGIAWAVAIDNPWPLLVALPIGCHGGAFAARGEAMGTRDRAPTRS